MPEKKLFAIHNSLDYDTQKALRERIQPSDIYKEHFKNDHPTIIFIGRLIKDKKLDILVDALAKLRERDEMYNLVFVGNGTQKEELESHVSRLSLNEQVWFYGACYDECTNAELIFNSDLCIVPGAIGLTAIHSMMFGVPVITHDYFPNHGPEFESIKSGITGEYFKHNDSKSLVSAIQSWFSIHRDDRDAVRQACFNEIDTKWNPYFQMDMIKKNLKLV